MSKLLLLCAILCSQFAQGSCNYTQEQSRLIKLAASYGLPYNYSKTLAAIVVNESFVGKYVVRINNKDMPYGSYGVTQVKLDTAMYLLDVKSSWYALQSVAPKLITDDVYALGLAVKKLESIKHIDNGNWRKLWANYNGGKHKITYSNNIVKTIIKLDKCGYFKWG